MRNLFLFLWRYNFFIFFLVLEAFSGYLIVQNNNFQRASFINSTNTIAAEVNTMVSAVTQYINLRTTNDALSRQNASLRTIVPDVFYIDSVLKQLNVDSIHKQQYTFMAANVVNNSINRRNNYLTLNKGSLQGIHPEMGVVSAEGIVGIVKDVSEHYCSVLSFLHKDCKISARFKKNGYIGSMVWDGTDPTHGSLNDIAKHVKINLGDTIITSSFSAIFPEGIMIGTVDKVDPNSGDNFQEIEVKLSTSFANLTYVYIVSNLFKEEQRKLEESQPNDH
ncbi:MAG: rod shape-determining protein MreC [Bacteroidetes bacterium]|nr:rod shape-determining protein MreC [Bacteroidota bacterium]MBK9523496.1 rod shape-determining protein MreC [Bacteroidota bacterium]MBK9541242.1 rod shape-determining protein MreC [Bacteroidota bacterium]